MQDSVCRFFRKICRMLRGGFLIEAAGLRDFVGLLARWGGLLSSRQIPWAQQP